MTHQEISDKAKKYSKINYARAHDQTPESAEYIQNVSYFTYVAAYKQALQDISLKLKDAGSDKNG